MEIYSNLRKATNPMKSNRDYEDLDSESLFIESQFDQSFKTPNDGEWYESIPISPTSEEDEERVRLFWQAIRTNNINNVGKCLEGGVDPNIPNYEGNGELALMEATYRGYAEIVEYLLEAGANINTRNIQGDTAIHVAAHPQKFNSKICLLFLESPDADFSIKDHKGYTPLHVLLNNIVLRKGTSSQMIEEILGVLKLFIKRSDINQKTYDGDTPLHLAVSGCRENVDAVKILIANGADLDMTNERMETPLLTAINNNHSSLAEALIIAGADHTARDSNMQCALHRAAQTNLPDVVRLLVVKHCNVNSIDKMGDTALHIASGRGYIRVVKSLLAHPNIQILVENQQKHTALHCALASGFCNVVHTLFVALKIPIKDLDKESTFLTLEEFLRTSQIDSQLEKEDEERRYQKNCKNSSLKYALTKNPSRQDLEPCIKNAGILRSNKSQVRLDQNRSTSSFHNKYNIVPTIDPKILERNVSLILKRNMNIKDKEPDFQRFKTISNSDALEPNQKSSTFLETENDFFDFVQRRQSLKLPGDSTSSQCRVSSTNSSSIQQKASKLSFETGTLFEENKFF